jgi:hypothetical protein
VTPATAFRALFTYSRYVMISRPARTSFAAVATGAAMLATLGTGPAQAGLFTIPVDCQVDNVVLDQDNATYELHGTCGVVTVTGDNVTVSDMPATRKLLVKGQNDVIGAKPVDRVVVHGRDNQITVRSARIARVDSPGSTLDVTGLLETGRVPGNRSRVHAERLTKLVVDGDRNLVRVDRGSTIVDNDGRHNRIRVHQHA